MKVFDSHVQLSKNFNSVEFDSPDVLYSGNNINMLLVNKLQLLRDLCGFPLIVNSGVRSFRHNELVGGVVGSTHTTFEAVDISVLDNSQRYAVIINALIVGFKRIGLKHSMIHLDISEFKKQDVFWLYNV